MLSNPLQILLMKYNADQVFNLMTENKILLNFASERFSSNVIHDEKLGKKVSEEVLNNTLFYIHKKCFLRKSDYLYLIEKYRDTSELCKCYDKLKKDIQDLVVFNLILNTYYIENKTPEETITINPYFYDTAFGFKKESDLKQEGRIQQSKRFSFILKHSDILGSVIQEISKGYCYAKKGNYDKKYQYSTYNLKNVTEDEIEDFLDNKFYAVEFEKIKAIHQKPHIYSMDLKNVVFFKNKKEKKQYLIDNDLKDGEYINGNDVLYALYSCINTNKEYTYQEWKKYEEDFVKDVHQHKSCEKFRMIKVNDANLKLLIAQLLNNYRHPYYKFIERLIYINNCMNHQTGIFLDKYDTSKNDDGGRLYSSTLTNLPKEIRSFIFPDYDEIDMVACWQHFQVKIMKDAGLEKYIPNHIKYISNIDKIRFELSEKYKVSSSIIKRVLHCFDLKARSVKHFIQERLEKNYPEGRISLWNYHCKSPFIKMVEENDEMTYKKMLDVLNDPFVMAYSKESKLICKTIAHKFVFEDPNPYSTQKKWVVRNAYGNCKDLKYFYKKKFAGRDSNNINQYTNRKFYTIYNAVCSYIYIGMERTVLDKIMNYKIDNIPITEMKERGIGGMLHDAVLVNRNYVDVNKMTSGLSEYLEKELDLSLEYKIKRVNV